MFLKPDYNLKNVYEIDFKELKSQGVKCLMFDLDSTVMVSKSANFFICQPLKPINFLKHIWRAANCQKAKVKNFPELWKKKVLLMQ